MRRSRSVLIPEVLFLHQTYSVYFSRKQNFGIFVKSIKPTFKFHTNFKDEQDMTILNFKLLLLTFCVSWSKGVDESHQGFRYLRSVGFEHVGIATISEINDGEPQSFDEGRLRERRSTGDGENVHLNIQVEETGDEFQLHLRHARSVLHPQAKLFRSEGDIQIEMKRRDVNCILSNKPGDTMAVISYCRNTRGVFHHNGYEYAIETLDELTNHRNKRSEKRFIIAKRSPEENLDIVGDTAEDLEEVVREKRDTQTTVERPDNFEIETALVVDADMVAYMKSCGHPEYDDWLDYMLIRWTGVQAIWSDKDLIGFDVKISLKYVDIWETDPSYYTSSKSTGSTTKLVCNHASDNNWPYDHIHLQLGSQNGSPLGIAWIDSVCTSLKCSGIRSRDCFSVKGTSHEIGHNLGLPHNNPTKGYCGPGDGGIMGYGNFGLSSCNKAKLRETVSVSPKHDCLFEVNVNTSNVAELDDKYPGQNMLPDDLCVARYGENYVYEPSDPICSEFQCRYMGYDGKWGIKLDDSYIPRGIYCGDRQMCIRRNCMTWEESGRNVTELEENVVVGVWSEWGDYGPCSRTCGTGVKLSHRICNNPTPVNSPLCDGQSFRAELCENEACDGDSEDFQDQKNIRASEVCEMKINSGVIDSEKFSGIGAPNMKTYDGVLVCKMRCALIGGGYDKSDNSKGLMPDGSWCKESDPDLDNSFHCAYGRCLEFGCDGILISQGGQYADECGVCGGNGDSCS